MNSNPDQTILFPQVKPGIYIAIEGNKCILLQIIFLTNPVNNIINLKLKFLTHKGIIKSNTSIEIVLQYSIII